MHGGEHELVMLVLQVGEALREIAGVMIVDVGERRDAVRRLLLLQAETLELGTHQVAHGLRPVLVALAMDEIVELLRQSFAQRNRESLHIGCACRCVQMLSETFRGCCSSDRGSSCL